MRDMKKYKAEDVRECLSNSCGLLIAASRLINDKNLKTYSSALVELSFEELGKTLCIYRMSELGETFLKKVESAVVNCESTFSDHDVKIDIVKQFTSHILDEYNKNPTLLNNREIIKEIPKQLGLNKKKEKRLNIDRNKKYNFNPASLKKILEITNRYFNKYIVNKDHALMRNMREDSLYAKYLSGKIVKDEKVDTDMIATMAFSIFSISIALIKKVGELKFTSNSILCAANILSVKSSLLKEIREILKPKVEFIH